MAVPDEVMKAARALMASGDLAQADDMLRDALASTPADPDLLYLRGVVANRRGDPLAACERLTAAISIRPTMTEAWLALGHARVRLDALTDAMEAYERAATLEPQSADARFNLGVVRRRLGDVAGAARAFHAAWRRDPLLPNAAKACVASLAAWARSSPDAQLRSVQPVAADAQSVSVIVCSIDDTKAANATALHERLLADVRHEIIVIRDAASLAEAYNRGVARAGGDVIVLSHDDIDVLAPDFAARLLSHLDAYDVVGVVGGTRTTGPLPIWAGHPYLRGWITHHAHGDTEWHVDLLDPEPIAGGLTILDGVLLAARREVFAAVPFDAATFDGFHGYDIDWSHRAALAGYRLAAAGDLLLVHASRGRYDDAWQRYAERFCRKHRTGAVDPAPPPFYEASFASSTEVQAFLAHLMQLAVDHRV